MGRKRFGESFCGKMFTLDALVLSGDMTGKVIVPIIERTDGKYDASLLGTAYTLSKEDIPEFMKRCRMVSYIPYVTNPEEAKIYESDSEKREKLFEKLEVEIVKYWMDLVPEKVPKNRRVIISPGNDDKFAIDDAIRGHPAVIYGEEKVVPLDDEHEVACFAWSNPTPFNSPREYSEDELLEKLEAVVSQIKNMKTAIFCFHVPPYRSEIDTAPLLDKNLRPIVFAGQQQTCPAGSKGSALVQ